LNLGGFLGGIKTKADTLGTLAGFLTGSTNGIGDVTDSVTNLLSGQVHIPDVANFANWAQQPYLKSSLMLYIAGEVIGALGVPKISGWSKAMKDGAVGYASGSFMNLLLWSMTHADQGSDPTKNGRWANNFVTKQLPTVGYEY